VDTLTSDLQTVVDSENRLVQSAQQLKMSLNLSQQRLSELESQDELRKKVALQKEELQSERERALCEALQSTLNSADERELEHKEVRCRLEAMVMQRQAERDAFRLALSERERETSEVFGAVRLMLIRESFGNKENCNKLAIADNAVFCEKVDTENIAVMFTDNKADCIRDEWFEDLLTQSLALHESLVLIWPLVISAARMLGTKSDLTRLSEAWVNVSSSHHRLHESLVSAPWLCLTSLASPPSLTPAHELSFSLSPDVFRPLVSRAKTFSIAAKFIIRLLVRRWQSHRNAPSPSYCAVSSNNDLSIASRVVFLESGDAVRLSSSESLFTPVDVSPVIESSVRSLFPFVGERRTGLMHTPPREINWLPTSSMQLASTDNSLFISPGRVSELNESLTFSLSDLDDSLSLAFADQTDLQSKDTRDDSERVRDPLSRSLLLFETNFSPIHLS
jgi:hypothetical protein